MRELDVEENTASGGGQCIGFTSPNVSRHFGNDSGAQLIWTSAAGTLPLLEYATQWTPAVVQRLATLAVLIPIALIGNIAVVSVLTCGRLARRCVYGHRKWGETGKRTAGAGSGTGTGTGSKNSNSRMNIFIVNLAMGDLTVCCFTMTTEVLFVSFDSGWTLGVVGCKV